MNELVTRFMYALTLFDETLCEKTRYQTTN